jgi:DNA uptake protein ComE-like DNA-binding protein
MWKDFFYFSKGQQLGIIVLLSLILLVTIVNYSLPLFFRLKPTHDDGFLIEVAAFKKSLISRDSINQVKRQANYLEKYKHYSNYQYDKPIKKVSLFSFDPNTVDSTTLVMLGLKGFTISNLLRYRSKGGHFRMPEDLGKVYGISPQKLEELKVFVSIKPIVITKIDSIPNPKKQIKQAIIVDLNSADTSLLVQVKGIGRGYAKGIVGYRLKLGGFVSVEQLKEIFGMRPENYERILPFCKVNLELVQRINVNSATAEKLNRHPYINFYQAKAIYELRRNKGKLHSFNDLKSISEIKAGDIKRLQAYLSFE